MRTRSYSTGLEGHSIENYLELLKHAHLSRLVDFNVSRSALRPALPRTTKEIVVTCRCATRVRSRSQPFLRRRSAESQRTLGRRGRAVHTSPSPSQRSG